MTIHINLLSAQIIPNAIPVLAMKNSVDKVYLVVAGDAFDSKAEHLKEFYLRNGIEEVEKFLCPDASDYYSLKFKAKELFDDIQAFHPGQRVILNATCGTKPMSFAFVRQFDKPEENSLAIYVAANTNQIIFLSESDKLNNLCTSSVLSIEGYLYLNMFDISDKVDASCDHDVQSRALVSKSTLRCASDYPPLIRLVNSRAQTSNFNRPAGFLAEVPLKTNPHGSVEELFNVFKYQGLIQYSSSSITFESPDAARYIGGGWFEELIYLAAREAGVEEVALNVEGNMISGNGETSSVKNELDVVLLHNNHMMIVEAKTANWQGSVSSAQEVISKLDSLSQFYGGSDTQALIATFYPLPNEVEQRVASMRHVSTLQVKTFDQLVNTFSSWKQNISDPAV